MRCCDQPQRCRRVMRSPQVRQEFQGVLLGFRDYTPEQLTQLWDGAAHKPQTWLDRWEEELKAQ